MAVEPDREQLLPHHAIAVRQLVEVGDAGGPFRQRRQGLLALLSWPAPPFRQRQGTALGRGRQWSVRRPHRFSQGVDGGQQHPRRPRQAIAQAGVAIELLLRLRQLLQQTLTGRGAQVYPMALSSLAISDGLRVIEATLFHDGELGIGRVGTAGDQRTGVAHALAGGAVTPAMKPTTGFFMLALHHMGGFGFVRTTDFADHDDGVGVGDRR
jgi:hypothetical protein